MADKKPKIPTRSTCGGCTKSWSGVAMAHCSVCHTTFGGASGFDDHRSNGECRHPQALKFTYNPARGCWTKPYSTQRDPFASDDDNEEVVSPFRGRNEWEHALSVWFRIHVNARPIGDNGVVEIQRIRPRRIPTDPDTIGDYAVRLDGVDIGQIQHRYGDSIYRLIATATGLIAEWAHSTDDDEQEQQPPL